MKSYIFLNKFVEIQKYKSGDLEGRRTPERGKGAVGSGDVRLFFFIIWFAQEMRASNDWKQLWAVTSGAKIEQQFLQMQPLKQLPQLFPTPLYTSPACSVSSPPPPPAYSRLHLLSASNHVRVMDVCRRHISLGKRPKEKEPARRDDTGSDGS